MGGGVWLVRLVGAALAHCAMRSTRFVAAALLCVLSSNPQARQLEATVTRVVDGDTVWLQASAASDGKKPKPFKLRLQGIDAPESCQAWGAQATAALSARVLHQRVQIQARNKDDHSRTLGNIRCGMKTSAPGWSAKATHGAIATGATTGLTPSRSRRHKLPSLACLPTPAHRSRAGFARHMAHVF